MIRKRDERADIIVKLYLSALSISKVIPLAPRVSKKTFSTIITPLTKEQEESVSNFSELFVRDLPDLIQRYLPKVTQIPLQQGIRWRPSWKALPNYAVRRVLGMEASPYVYLPLELKAFGSNLRFIHSRGDQMSPLMLSLERIRYAFDARNEAECFNDLTIMESRPSKANVECEEAIRPMCRFGRLGQSCEGRAKRRILSLIHI